MAYDKVVDSAKLDAGMTATANAIRAKTGGTGAIPWKETTGFAEAVAGITSGGAAVVVSAPMKDVNFYDYDGTRLYSYTVAEAAALTELPPLPFHSGLICQGWNWTLADIKALGRAVDVGALYITNDGKTRIYITLQDGRTSPMLGCCPKGTVTVDWGDGTTPDVLSGNASSSLLSGVKWTPRHNYAAPGDYVITLTVSGKMWFYGRSSSNQYSAILRYSSEADTRNQYYKNAVRRIEIGGGIEEISTYAFSECNGLETITIPEEIKKVGTSAFYKCYSLRNINLSSIPYMPERLFFDCEGMKNVSIPNGILSLDTYTFSGCVNLSRVTIPDGVTDIKNLSMQSCLGVCNVIVPGEMANIGSGAFKNCHSVSYYDFTRCTAVPTLSNTDAFSGIADDCKIRVPAALADEWKAATNWSTYADYIVGV